MTQVELRCGSSSMVGFVDSKYAVRGRMLTIAGRDWTVSAVYATMSCAWWFKVTKAST